MQPGGELGAMWHSPGVDDSPSAFQQQDEGIWADLLVSTLLLGVNSLDEVPIGEPAFLPVLANVDESSLRRSCARVGVARVGAAKEELSSWQTQKVSLRRSAN